MSKSKIQTHTLSSLARLYNVGIDVFKDVWISDFKEELQKLQPKPTRLLTPAQVAFIFKKLGHPSEL